MVEPVERLRGQQEQSLVALHAAHGNQVTHNGIANARLAVVRSHRNARHFGHSVFEFVQGTTTVNAVVDAIDNIITQLFGNAFLCTRHQVTLVDVVLHNSQNIRNVFHVCRPDTGVLVGVHHGTVTASAENFLQHATLEFTAQKVNTVRTCFAGMNGVHQVIHLRKVKLVGIEFQQFLCLVHVHSRDNPGFRRFQVLGVLACHQAFQLDTVLVTDKEQLAHLHVLAKFSRNLSRTDVVGMTQLIPANRRNNRHELFVQKLFQNVALDTFDTAGTHVVDTVDYTHAAGQHPVALNAAQTARRQVTHDMLGNTQRGLLNMGQSFFAGQAHTGMEGRFQFPRLELGIDTVARTRHNDNADTRLVQDGDIAHQHRKKGMTHQVILDFQHKQLALEAFHVAEHFANKTGNLKMLRIKVRRRVVHIQ